MGFSTIDWVAGTAILIGTLLIPAAIRYWIVRRPLNQVSAGITAAGIWVALFSFFYWAADLVDQQEAFSSRSHVGIFLVALASYWIMTAKQKESGRQSDNTDE